jgi:hypothetical protein
MLYELVTRCIFSSGSRLTTETTSRVRLIATTITISSKLKPLARCRQGLAFVLELLMFIDRTFIDRTRRFRLGKTLARKNFE